MDINENILIAELNKIRKKQSFTPESHSDKEFQGEDLLTETIPQPEKVSEFSSEHQERDVIRLLISYPDSPLRFIDESDPQNPVEQHYTLAQVIISELKGEVEFAHPLYASVFNEFASSLEAGTVLTNSYFTNHPNKEIQQLAADLLTTRDDLSEQWEIIHNISTPREEQILEKSVRSSINALKQKKVQHLIHEYQEKIKNCSEEEELLNMLMILKQLKDLEIVLAKEKGTIITR